MTTTAQTAAQTSASTPANVVGRRPTLSPYLAVADARAAVAWYVDVFGGVLGESVEMPDGRLGHAEVHIGGSTLMATDGFNTGKMAFAGFSLSLEAKDPGEAAQMFAALSEGGKVLLPLGPTFFSSSFGMVADPFGVQWMIVVPQ